MKISVFLATAPKAAKKATDGKTRQVCFRVREGDADMRVRSGLLVDPSLWDSSIPGYRRTARLSKEEVETVNRQVSDITRLIHDGYTPDRDASWLRALVESVFRHIRAFLNWTLKQGITTNERWKGFTVSNEVYGTPVYLTLEERDRLLALDLRVFSRLERHRDMFIFQSLVGCRVGDLYRLTSDNIRDGFLEYCPRKIIGRDGNVYEAVTCRVPLNDKALALLAKYDGKCGKALFPCLNKILYGEDIKVVAMIAGLDRMVSVLDKKTAEVRELPLFMAVTTHTARKTFIANLYLRVKDPNLIASMTGHATNSKAFRRYRAISEQLKRELTAQMD